MKTKFHMLVCLLLLTAVFASCSKSEDPAPADPTLIIAPNTAIAFTATATESFDITVTTDQTSWDAVSSQTWCTVTKGNGKFTIRATANASTSSPAPAVITVTAGTARPVTINVTQSGIDVELSVNVDAGTPVSFTSAGGMAETKTITVTTNQSSWDVISNQSWCTINKIGNTFTATASANTGAEPRSAVVTVSAANAADVTINVTQAGVGAQLSVYPNTAITFTKNGGASEAKTITVTTNLSSWNAVSSQTWCTISKSGNQFTVTASANTASAERKATVTVSAGSAANITVEVAQAGVVSTVKAEYVTPGISAYFNPTRANYTINWPAITGASEYKVYKSAEPSGEGVLVTTTSDMTITTVELLTTAGTHIRYYWVTAKTNTDETLRPDNGGIKVTYTVTLANKVWMPNSIPPLYGSWVTFGFDNIERSITQNPIK